MAALAVSSCTMPGVSDEERGRVEEELRRRDLPPQTRARPEMVKAAALGQPLSAYLAETTGVPSAPEWLRALLSRRDFACGRPKHTLKHLQDAAEVDACKAERAEAGGKRGRRTGSVRVAR